MAAALSQALSLSLFLALASGSGWLLAGALGGGVMRVDARRSYVLGFLAVSSLYCAAFELNVPYVMAVGGTVVFLVIGLAALTFCGLRSRRTVVYHGLIALAIGAAWLIGTPIAGNGGAIDPWFYAGGAAVAFHSDWVATHVPVLSNGSALLATFHEVETTRSGATSILWPLVAQGAGLGVGEVTEAGVGLLLVTGLLCADLLPLPGNRLAAAASGIGAIGVYSAIAVLSGGQLQQAFALFVVIGCVWLARGKARLCSAALFGLCGYLLSGSYPEFLAALPLYVVVLATVTHQPITMTVIQIAAALAGFAVQQVFTRGASLSHLLSQSSAAPGWAPLPITPGWPGAIVSDLLLETRPPLAALVVVLLLGGLVWIRWRPIQTNSAMPRHIIVLLAVACFVWAAALARSQNLNYAVFKLGGWLAPGIVLLCFWLAASLEGRWQKTAYAIVLMFAFARLASVLYGGNEVLALGRVDAELRWPRHPLPGGGCVVAVDISTTALTAGGIAASAAPLYDCDLTPQN